MWHGEDWRGSAPTRYVFAGLHVVVVEYRPLFQFAELFTTVNDELMKRHTREANTKGTIYLSAVLHIIISSAPGKRFVLNGKPRAPSDRHALYGAPARLHQRHRVRACAALQRLSPVDGAQSQISRYQIVEGIVRILARPVPLAPV